jgi:hypothetical protein
MNEQSGFGTPSISQLTGLLFELAAQLHVERARRMALEAALLRAGLIAAADIELAGAAPDEQAAATAAADQYVRRLLRVLSDSTDERQPLRAEAPPAD